jgi:phospholipid/cholesterol/gamma-HCH transport system substrate-binding protein
MNNRAYALLTGVFVLVLAGALIALAVWLGRARGQSDPYVVVTQGAVNGLQSQSKVLFRGIAAGKVGSIGFDPRNPRRILIRIRVDRGIPITHATYAELRLQGFTGLSQITLDNGAGDLSPLATNNAHPAEIPMRASQFEQLENAGGVLAARLEQLSDSLNDLLNADNRAHLSRLLAQTDAASAALVKLENDLDKTARQLPALTAQSRLTLAQLQDTARHVSVLSGRIGALATAGRNQTLPQLNVTLGEINRAAVEMQQLADSLRKNPQQLLYGPARLPPGPGEPGYKEPQP